MLIKAKTLQGYRLDMVHGLGRLAVSADGEIPPGTQTPSGQTAF